MIVAYIPFVLFYFVHMCVVIHASLSSFTTAMCAFCVVKIKKDIWTNKDEALLAGHIVVFKYLKIIIVNM